MDKFGVYLLKKKRAIEKALKEICLKILNKL